MAWGTVVRVALAGAALAAFTLSPAVALDAARSGRLAGGGTYLLRPTGGADVAAIALWFRAPAAGFDSIPSPGIARLAAEAIAASQPITGTSLVRFIDQIGGRLAVTAYPDSVAVSTLVPSNQANATVRALTQAYFAPVLTDPGLAVAKRDEVGEAEALHADPESSIEAALYGALFTGGPAKYPTYGDATAVTAVTLDQVRPFAERAFRPSNAFLVATGQIDDRIVDAAIPGRAGAAPGPESAEPEELASAPAPIENHGDEPGFGLMWAGPPINDERSATALDFIADYLFSPDNGTVQRAAHASGSEIAGTFVTFHDPGVFIVTATGGDVAAARRAVDDGLAAIRQPLDAKAFEAARRAFTFHLLSDQQTPSGLTDTYGWYAVEGDAAYAPGEVGAGARYWAAVAALTPAFVAQTATRYLGRAGAMVTVVASPPAASGSS